MMEYPPENINIDGGEPSRGKHWYFLLDMILCGTRNVECHEHDYHSYR